MPEAPEGPPRFIGRKNIQGRHSEKRITALLSLTFGTEAPAGLPRFTGH